MKGKLSIIGLSLLLTSHATFAAKPIPVGIKSATFAPVPWHATVENGGFSVMNQTNSIQYVQVTIEKGEISVGTILDGKLDKCSKDLNAEYGWSSVVCELAPSEVLFADLDLAKMEDATGTYQVEMDK